MSIIIVTGSATLKEFIVNYSNIDDERMEIISEALQHNITLTNLAIGYSKLSAKGNCCGA